MQSVLCFGNAWSGGFMQKCVFQAVNSTHAWNMEWDASFLLVFWRNIYSLQIFKNVFKQHEKRPRDIFVSCFIFIFLLKVNNLSRTLHT